MYLQIHLLFSVCIICINIWLKSYEGKNQFAEYKTQRTSINSRVTTQANYHWFIAYDFLSLNYAFSFFVRLFFIFLLICLSRFLDLIVMKLMFDV